MMYRFLVDVDYDPTGKRHEAGKLYSLKEWRKRHVENALRSGLIEEAGEDKEEECRDKS